MNNPFKNFIPMLVPAAKVKVLSADTVAVLKTLTAVDPGPTEWRRLGFVSPMPDDALAIGLDGAGAWLCMQFNERVLPGKVRDEEVKKRVKQIQEMEDRKVTKTEYAQIRDETEMALLPKAFIRRTQVHMIVTKSEHPDWRWFLVFTSSAKRLQDIMFRVNMVFCKDPMKETVWHSPGNKIQAAFRELANGNLLGNYQTFAATDHLVLKGKDKQTIRISDKEISDHEVQDLCQWDDGYWAHEIGLQMGLDADGVSFKTDMAGVFKAFTMHGVKPDKDDRHHFAVLNALSIAAMLKNWHDEEVTGMTWPHEQVEEDDEEV